MTEALIAGAGPTGLTLACELAWRGVPVRIIDARPEPSRHSKAIGVFPRTLELLENHGVAERMVERGVRVRGVNVHAEGRRLARIDTGRIASHYNFVLTLEQSETERFLIERLGALGVRVERPVELVSLHQDCGAVHAVLETGPEREGARQPDAEREAVSVPWLVGCDGSRSFVRESLGVSFEGERYQEAFNLADVELHGEVPDARDHINLFLSRDGVMFAAPLPGGRHRLIADEPPGSASEERPDPTLDDFSGWWRRRVEYFPAKRAELAAPGWLSRFTIQRRMAPSVREGRVLLAGDAMHVHSPAGAQGMNGGIQDAVNLGWKLALVATGAASQALLDSYGAERLPVAREVLKATHVGTTVLTSRNPVVGLVRNRAMSLVLRSDLVQRRAVNSAAELRVNYRRSPIVEGEGRRRPMAPVAGDRAPDTPLARSETLRLYDALRQPGHTLLVFAGKQPVEDDDLRRAAEVLGEVEDRYGELVSGYLVVVGPEASRSVEARTVLLDPDGAAHMRYGMQKTGLCLLRPDRYVALRTESLDSQRLHDHLERSLPREGRQARMEAQG